MADQQVLNAQKYLNNMYGHHSSWVHLDENGNTGTLMIEGLIRAFQIQNNVPNVTGYLGPYTIQVMKNLAEISIMDPNSTPNPNVCLIQCALFCKGYNAGGITGIYYTTGVNAVKEMQEDANIGVTGIINWKVWTGLFSMYWFKLVSGGNITIQSIQRQLNGDWSNVIGVQACDGVMSRNTALSLLGALQAAEGIVDWIDDLSVLNFGPATTEAFPTLSQGVNGDNIKFNKIAQYGLYFNGIDQIRFDGIFDANMATNVSLFQDKYGLTGMISDQSGVVGVSTMKSLLTSKGDTDRLALGCDCSTVLNATQAKDLYDSGYRYIGRYLTGTVGSGLEERTKALTVTEINNIKTAGLSVFPIYQDGGYYADYFGKTMQGGSDAITAIKKAERLGFLNGTIIYFAVDFDCLDYQTDDLIIPYFQQISLIFNTSSLNKKNYKVGIYAPRYVCTRVCEEGYADYSFVSDMSTGFSGNLGYPIPDNWAFDQFYEYLFSSSPSFDLDKVAVSGLDGGCKNFEAREEFDNEALLYEARVNYLTKCLQSTTFINKIPSLEFNFSGGEYNLGVVSEAGITIAAKMKLASTIVNHSDSPGTLIIGFENGQLNSSFQAELTSILSSVQGEELKEYIEEMIDGIAYNIQIGNITYRYKYSTSNTLIVSIICETDNLIYGNNLEGSVSCEFEFTVSVYGDKQDSINFENQIDRYAKMAACTVCLLATSGAFGLFTLGPILTQWYAYA